jgi:protein phosphatase 2C family protein 2/3
MEMEEFQASDFTAALRNGFLKFDAELASNPELYDPAGCTAVVALVTGTKLYVANAGDSRAVLSTEGTVIPMSFDHKPLNAEERTRIVNAGGFVEFGRVNGIKTLLCLICIISWQIRAVVALKLIADFILGNLALSRALGDFEFKRNSDLPAEKQIVTADPQIIDHSLNTEDEFLIIACDGIWDCVENEPCVYYVRLLLALGKTLSQICEDLMDKCLCADPGGPGCDNMTVVLVAFLNHRSEEEWYTWMREKYAGYCTDNPPKIVIGGHPVIASSDEPMMSEDESQREDSMSQSEGEEENEQSVTLT